jgi:hypothetical protein
VHPACGAPSPFQNATTKLDPTAEEPFTIELAGVKGTTNKIKVIAATLNFITPAYSL